MVLPRTEIPESWRFKPTVARNIRVPKCQSPERYSSAFSTLSDFITIRALRMKNRRRGTVPGGLRICDSHRSLLAWGTSPLFTVQPNHPAHSQRFWSHQPSFYCTGLSGDFSVNYGSMMVQDQKDLTGSSS